jgi:8-oxo-dGTP pyrophosphatase MutT (NUDIX family)
MIGDWDILGREVVGDFGFFKVQQKQALSPRTGEVRPVQAIRLPDFVMVLPITPDEDVVMVRQYRHGIERVCLELPGGLVDPEDPSPSEAAGRELLEETGFAAERISALGKCYPLPAVLTHKGRFYLAAGVRQVREPEPDPGEDIEIVRVPLKKIGPMIDRGEIDHGMVQLAFFLYWRRK